MGYYSSLGGGRGSGQTSARAAAAARRQQAQQEKLEEARRLLATFERLLTIHHAEFEPAEREVATLETPDEAAVHRRQAAFALRRIRLVDRSGRALARERAAEAAARELESAQRRMAAERAARQEELDRHWAALASNDMDAVVAALNSAFEDNDATAGVVGIGGTEVSLVVMAPSEDVVPERMPGRTDAGNLTLRKMSKTDRRRYYAEAVAGHLLATAKEAFATAPGIVLVRMVLFRQSAHDAYGARQTEALVAAAIERGALLGVRWEEVGAWDALSQICTELKVDRRTTNELKPLKLSKEPDIAEVLSRVHLVEALD